MSSTVEYNRLYRHQNREKVRAWQRKYREEHKTEANRTNKEWRQKHKEAIKEYQDRYRQEHEADIKAWRRDYYLKHREETLAGGAVYRQEHRSELIARNKENRQRYKLQALTRYSVSEVPQCARCGVTDVDVLCIDHINGGGNKHKRLVGYSNIYPWLKTNGFPEGFQVLCCNCNMKKRIVEDFN